MHQLSPGLYYSRRPSRFVREDEQDVAHAYETMFSIIILCANNIMVVFIEI